MLLLTGRIGQHWRVTRAVREILRSDRRRGIVAITFFGELTVLVTLENESDKLRGFGGRATKRVKASDSIQSVKLQLFRTTPVC